MSSPTAGNKAPHVAALLLVEFTVDKYGLGEFLVDPAVIGEPGNPSSRYRRAVRSWRWDKRAPGSVLMANDLTLIQHSDPKDPYLHWHLTFDAKRQDDDLEFRVILDVTFDTPTDYQCIEADCTIYRFRAGYVTSPNAQGAITSVTVTSNGTPNQQA